MHYFKLNIGDYHKRAGRLTMIQHGAYNLLIQACYDREKFPTREEAHEWLWASSDEEIKAIDFVLSKLFTINGERYEHENIAEDIKAYKKRGEVNKQIALDREAKKRKKRTKQHETCNDNHETCTIGGDSCTNEYEHSTNEHLTKNQEPRTTNHKPLTKDQESLSSSVFEVFDYWAAVMKKDRSRIKLNDKRKRLIQSRLKEGWTIEDLKRAIDGCKASDFHQGREPGNPQIHDSIDLITRDGSHVEQFMELAERPERQWGDLTDIDYDVPCPF